MKKINSLIASLLILISLLTGCGSIDKSKLNLTEAFTGTAETEDFSGESAEASKEEEPPEDSISENSGDTEADGQVNGFDIKNVPPYSGMPYAVVNGNVPYFKESDRTAESFELYSPLDSLGRCGAAFANIGIDIMPTGERGSIGYIKPTGWHTVKYDNVQGKYLYNRCHLIGYQLSGENANEENLITGTRYMNVKGMLPFENMTADYVKETGKHVLYRVTPIFEGRNLLASGVLMEAMSTEDGGAGICFNVFCYNVQPGINIDYATGNSSAK